MLFIGEKVGSGGPAFDIALDPLEGTTITAKGGQNAMAVIAMAEAGHFLNAPDTYMNKIAVGGGLPDDLVDLRSEEHTSELQSLMRISYAVFCLKKKKTPRNNNKNNKNDKKIQEERIR